MNSAPGIGETTARGDAVDVSHGVTVKENRKLGIHVTATQL